MSKAFFQSFKTMSARQINRRIVFMFAMSSIFYAGMAYSLDTAAVVDSAERIDKLGATGILALGFILSIVANIYLIRLVFGKMNDTLKENTVALTRVADAIGHCQK